MTGGAGQGSRHRGNPRHPAVRPGLILTEIHASGGDPWRVERLLGQVPMRRAGSADEVAQSIVWLCSPQSGYVTGAVLDVGGGR